MVVVEKEEEVVVVVVGWKKGGGGGGVVLFRSVTPGVRLAHGLLMAAAAASSGRGGGGMRGEEMMGGREGGREARKVKGSEGDTITHSPVQPHHPTTAPHSLTTTPSLQPNTHTNIIFTSASVPPHHTRTPNTTPQAHHLTTPHYPTPHHTTPYHHLTTPHYPTPHHTRPYHHHTTLPNITPRQAATPSLPPSFPPSPGTESQQCLSLSSTCAVINPQDAPGSLTGGVAEGVLGKDRKNPGPPAVTAAAHSQQRVAGLTGGAALVQARHPSWRTRREGVFWADLQHQTPSRDAHTSPAQLMLVLQEVARNRSTVYKGAQWRIVSLNHILNPLALGDHYILPPDSASPQDYLQVYTAHLARCLRGHTSVSQVGAARGSVTSTDDDWPHGDLVNLSTPSPPRLASHYTLPSRSLTSSRSAPRCSLHIMLSVPTPASRHGPCPPCTAVALASQHAASPRLMTDSE
ncbi:hypothetical protein O3P69_015244 [Scylla paramamosain]|uniref:Uncharacterized protein n=1 Tax=Scylla paramamosain TaxID=85552 RepID=A0AAW0T5A9_SCYPA